MQKVAILYDASQAVLSTFDLDEVLRQILTIIRDYFQLPHSAVFLLDERNGDLFVRQSGWPEEYAGFRIPVGRGIVGCAAQLQRPIHAPDISQDERYVEAVPGTRSELAIPLMVQDQVVGVLDCQSDREDFFDEETIDLLTLFSTQASIALQNARLYELERQRAAQLEAINLIARQTTAVTDLNELPRTFCVSLLKTFSADHVSVLLLDENRLVLRAHEGRLKLRIHEGSDLPASTGLFGRALARRTPVLCDDLSKEPDCVPCISDARSELCLPLISLGQPLGVLSLASAREAAFRDSDLKTLESVADICAATLQNAIYFDRVRQLAFRDGLTGTFNRRFFEMRILEELERARRYHSVLSVLLLDMDGFKSLNDEFGHLQGDEALRQISSIFLQHVRKADIVCRYGGDEFAVLLPETNGEHAFQAAEKLRRAIAEWGFAGVPRSVSISVGGACFPECGCTRDALIKAADDALYRAKEQGRNQVVFAGIDSMCGAGR